jgi:glycine dehydrogenase subunit 1
VATGAFTPAFDQPFLKEFAVRTTLDIEKLQSKLIEKGVLGGVALGRYKKGMEDGLLFCVTEKRSKAQIDQLITIIKEEMR